MAFVWVTALAALAQFVSDAYRKFDVDYEEGDVWVKRWISWGTCRALSKNPDHDFRYFMLFLPSYRWDLAGYRNEWCWHQLVIRKFAGEWSTHWISE